MRWLIEYIKSCFCKHDFDFQEEFCVKTTEFGWKKGPKISATCKKCAYHKSYWKY